jgi:hypothetical protein
LNDDYNVSFKDIGPRIDSKFNLGSFVTGFLDHARKALHSYTHGGALQVMRRFTEGELQPSYLDGELLEVINATTTTVLLVTTLFAHEFGLKDEWQQANDLILEWGKT